MKDSDGTWKPLECNKQRRTEPFRQEMSQYGHPYDGYVIRWAYEKLPAHWVDFAVFKIEGCDSEGPRYPVPNSTGSGDDTEDIEQAGPMVEGFVKWDGCTQFTVPDGVHVDSREGLDDMLASIAYARQLAMVEIIGDNQDCPSEYPDGMDL